MNAIYWCEFPEKVDWKKLASWLDKKIVVYVTCSSRKDFESKKIKIQKYSKLIEVNAWPKCPKKEGYWFSGFSSKKTIDRLDEYRGLKFKVDIEPPIPKYYNLLSAFSWIFFNLFKTAKNKRYLKEKIISLSKDSEIIMSTFPLPLSFLKRWGWVYNRRLKYNFMHYSTFIPSYLLWAYNLYYKSFIRKHPDSYFTVGLAGTGIFGSEPVYKSIDQMKRDIKFLKREGVKNIVFFEIGAITDRGKAWFKATCNI